MQAWQLDEIGGNFAVYLPASVLCVASHSGLYTFLPVTAVPASGVLWVQNVAVGLGLTVARVDPTIPLEDRVRDMMRRYCHGQYSTRTTTLGGLDAICNLHTDGVRRLFTVVVRHGKSEFEWTAWAQPEMATEESGFQFGESIWSTVRWSDGPKV